MKRSAVLATLLAVVLALALTSAAALAAGEKQNPDPGQDPTALSPNLSFPVVMTTPLEQFFVMVQATDPLTGELLWTSTGDPVMVFATGEDGDYIPLPAVDEYLHHIYSGSHPGMTDFDYGWWELVQGDDPATPDVIETDYHVWTTLDYIAYLNQFPTWYVQPTDEAEPNTWQADWALWEKTLLPDDPNYLWDLVFIDFVDWGNPLENINPMVGYRFPVEVALYQKLDAAMTAYKMACLEYMSTRDELFGTTGDLWESMYATVLTTDFDAWVVDPNGVQADISLEPAAGPSGKMNFASSDGGWMPKMPGWHRIYLQINDENIWLRDAVVNNDEHYCMTCGVMCEELSSQKQELTGIYYNQTWIDVYVVPQSGKRPK